MSLEQPTPPPVSGQVLEELHSYYQQLVSYHAQGLEEAKRMLSHMEVLMQGKHLWNFPTHNSTMLNAQLETALPPSKPQAAPQLLELYQGMSLLGAIQVVLASNPGELLHVEYIARILYGNEEPNPELTQKIASVCRQGVEEGRWFAFPDSPLCFTITPMHLAPGSSQSVPAYPVPFPTAKLKAQYRHQTTIKGMVLSALEANEKSMDAQELSLELFEYFPEDEGRNIRKTLAKAMQNACARGLLKRTDKGRYMFKRSKKRS